MVEKIIVMVRFDTGDDESVTVKSVDKEPDKESLKNGVLRILKEHSSDTVLYFTVRKWVGKAKSNWKFKTLAELEEWLDK